MENPLLFSIARVLHLKNHLKALDSAITEENRPGNYIKFFFYNI